MIDRDPVTVWLSKQWACSYNHSSKKWGGLSRPSRPASDGHAYRNQAQSVNPRRVTKPKSTANTHAQMCPRMERKRTYVLTGVIASMTKILREVACMSCEASCFLARVYNRREGRVSHSVYGAVCHPWQKFMTFHWCLY